MPQRPAQPIPTIQPTAKADTFSSSTADKSGFDDMLGDVTYEMVSLEEPVPGLLHAVFDVKNFYFADRIDRYLLLSVANRACSLTSATPNSLEQSTLMPCSKELKCPGAIPMLL